MVFVLFALSFYEQPIKKCPMRFSIRDLLWLMAVVALGATLYAERVRLRRLTIQWEQMSEKQTQENAAAQAALRATISRVVESNNILRHQITVHLDREQKRDAAEAARAQSKPRLPRSAPRSPLPLVNLPNTALE